MGPSITVLGKRGEHSHAWLQRDEIIIDIPADQFPEVDHAVIVTATPTWHDGFASEVLHEADFTIYDPHSVAMLGAAYHAVMQHMENASMNGLVLAPAGLRAALTDVPVHVRDEVSGILHPRSGMFRYPDFANSSTRQLTITEVTT